MTKKRVVRDGCFEFRVRDDAHFGRKIEYRVVDGNWDYRTYHRTEQAPALTEERIRIWAALLDNPDEPTPEQHEAQG